jgi:hypothetical protein
MLQIKWVSADREGAGVGGSKHQKGTNFYKKSSLKTYFDRTGRSVIRALLDCWISQSRLQVKNSFWIWIVNLFFPFIPNLKSSNFKIRKMEYYFALGSNTKS